MEYDTVSQITAEQLHNLSNDEQLTVFDVRKESEFLSEHLIDANSTPLDYLNDHLAEFPSEPFYLHCARGYRSMIAASILKSRGIHNLIDISGGFEAMKEVGAPITDYVCPSTP